MHCKVTLSIVIIVAKQDESPHAKKNGFCYKGVFGFDTVVKSLPSSPLLIRFSVMTAGSPKKTVRVHRGSTNIDVTT